METKSENVRPIICSIGVDGNGKAIIRVSINGSMRSVDTNVISFAMLAKEGVKVINGYR